MVDFFYQNYNSISAIDGSYAFKTSSDDYYIVNYKIENPFQVDLASIGFFSSDENTNPLFSSINLKSK